MKNSFVENIEDHGVFSDESFDRLSKQKIPPGDVGSPIPIGIRLRETIFICCCQLYMHIRVYCYRKQRANQNENLKRLIPVKMTYEASVWLRT